MIVNWYSPMPPDKSGVAIYSAEIIRHLVNVDIRINPGETESNDINIYSIGNHPLHNSIYSIMLMKPGIVFIHDLNIHDLIYFRTAGKGKNSAYVNYLLNEKQIGRNDIMHLLYTDFPKKYNFFRKYNLIKETALHNNYFIVHTEHTLNEIMSINPLAKVLCINHFSVWSEYVERNTEKDNIKIGIFGYISGNRHINEIINVFAAFIEKAHKHYSIVIAGTDMESAAQKAIAKRGMQEFISIISYPSDTEFLNIMKGVDYGINIRFPHNGEVSGNMIKMMGFGVPVAANATDADFPENTYFPIDSNDISGSLSDFFNKMEYDPGLLEEIGGKAYRYIQDRCKVNDIALSIEDFILGFRDTPVKGLKKYRKSELMKYFAMRDRIKMIIGRKR